MCGIFGYIKNQENNISDKTILKNLVLLSESRGKESSGIALINNNKIVVYKIPERGSALIKNSAYKNIVNNELKAPFAVIGHARLVTNGLMEDNINNQPVIKDGMVGIHNGIIVNDSNIWNKFPDLKKESDIDTEVLLALIRLREKSGLSLVEAIKSAFGEIEGTASIALLFNDYPYLLLATNNGSLYFFEYENTLIFASEEYILKSLIKKNNFKNKDPKIQRIEPNEGYLIHIKNLDKLKFSLAGVSLVNKIEQSENFLKIDDLSSYEKIGFKTPPSLITQISLPENFSTLDQSPIKFIKRCSRCILPQTMPFINFDETGICNYCHNYQKTKLRKESGLKKIILSSKRKSTKFDCVVPLSGGRDSSFALHFVKKVMGLNPIAYSYDWGMLTDLGRRNQARMCGKLGIEHILVSADIKKKRANIRKNVIAWLKKPNLGTIPLFMAGDKQYFYFANQLSKNIGNAPIIYAENPLEKTDFKSGFCGIPPVFGIDHVYNLGLKNKIKLGAYYFKEFTQNPSLINSSVFDTLSAYVSSYFIPHDYISLYLYKQWDEKEITTTLVNEYNWELAKDTKTSWRIGDGTAAFYNFIYYSVAGFTEADTFRSNQIREGVISREVALRLVSEENSPRYKSIKWYCDIIGIDFGNTLNKILAIPKLY